MRKSLLLVCLLALPHFARAADVAIGVADTTNIIQGQSLSLLFPMNKDSLQTFLGLHRTHGMFEFGAGGAYKVTLHGDRRTGLHFGPGLSVGTASRGPKTKFAFSAFGLVGGHHTLFERLIVSVDGGPIMTVLNGDVDLGIKPAGNMLGLAIHYQM